MVRTRSPDTLPLDVELIHLSLSHVIGMEVDTAEWLTAHDHETDFVINADAWNPAVLKLLYLQTPMLLMKRTKGYYCLGSGRAYRLAQELFSPDDEVTALLVKSKRLGTEVKLQILAADLLGFAMLHRTRRRQRQAHFRIWNELTESGVAAFRGQGIEDFIRATGYSRRDLSSPRLSRSAPPLEPGELTEADAQVSDPVE